MVKNKISLIQFSKLSLLIVSLPLLISSRLLSQMSMNIEAQGIDDSEDNSTMTEGLHYMAHLVKGQQAYYAEWLEFSENIPNLEMEVPQETQNYRFEILPQSEDSKSTIIIAQAKREQLYSFTGAVFAINLTNSRGQIEERSVAVICKTENPSTIPPNKPSPPNQNYSVTCPISSIKVAEF